MKGARILGGIFFAVLASAHAEAACPERLGVGFGDTLTSIARACGISVETLRAANPGLGDDTLRPGRTVTVPRPALPSPQLPLGRSPLRIAPSTVPPATAVSPPTVTPPPPLLQHPQMPRDFDVRPRHMRPREPFPPFPHQSN